ncbi:hypothetical protein [Stigmatella aurantiaca]|uniref:hypothetical protein n=1 Tax=Stigmatella aurantiaca TaxID=41 RepID=UPI0002FF123F|nr:hypothetical protein [Stigmatella aurantiaca]
MAKKDKGYAEHIKNPQSARPEPWPGIQGRSKEHEEELPTETAREAQADVTEAQRTLEREMDDAQKTRR